MEEVFDSGWIDGQKLPSHVDGVWTVAKIVNEEFNCCGFVVHVEKRLGHHSGTDRATCRDIIINEHRCSVMHVFGLGF